MGLFTRESPVGLDNLIDKAQRKLFDTLSAKWDVQIDAYPRCYIIEDKDGNLSIEHYVGNDEYSGPLIVSERNKFFFTAEENQERQNNEQFITRISLFFIIDIYQIFPESKDRLDGIVLRDVVNVLDKTPGFKSDYTIVTDFKSVFQNFDVTFDNLHPYYYFRIDINTNPYIIGQIC